MSCARGGGGGAPSKHPKLGQPRPNRAGPATDVAGVAGPASPAAVVGVVMGSGAEPAELRPSAPPSSARPLLATPHRSPNGPGPMPSPLPLPPPLPPCPVPLLSPLSLPPSLRRRSSPCPGHFQSSSASRPCCCCSCCSPPPLLPLDAKACK